MTRHDIIARSFGRAAASYDAHSAVQRLAAQRLADLIARQALPPAPVVARVLEIGCGTGHLTQLLTRRFAGADYLATDIAPAMLDICRQRLPALRYAVMDGERPTVSGGYDLVCSSLAAQWFADLPSAIARLAGLLAPGGVLALATIGEHTFAEWRAAHQTLGLKPGTPDFPSAAQLAGLFPPTGHLVVEEEQHIEHPPSALDFLRALRAIGAHAPAPGHRALTSGALRRVLRKIGARPAVTYHLIHALWRKPAN